MKRSLSAWPVALLTTLLIAACGPSGARQTGAKPTGQTQSALATSNGFVANGFVANGFVANGFVANGFVANGFVANGFSAPGLLQVAFTQANVLDNDLVMDALRADPIAQKFLQYLYSCAMPPGSSLGIDLDGNPATGVDGGAPGVDLILSGALGLAPQWGEPGGSCDLNCQRWLSACLLARTNAFGATVQLSARGPNLSGTPGWPLTVDPTSEEAQTFNRREGSYFGNIFNTRIDDAGTQVWDPKLYACAGPASDIPYLSLRFCSSTEDDCPIDAVANCAEDTAFSPAACDTTLGSSGEATNCYVHPSAKIPAEQYQQVITVYLKDELTAVCGNHICEPEGGETNESCPQDCHKGTWGNRIEMGTGLSTIAFDGMISLTSFDGWANFNFLSVTPKDEAVIGGYSAGDTDLGGGTLPVSRGQGYLAKYSADGSHLWSDRIGANVNAVATDHDGNILVLATMQQGVSSGVIWDSPGSSSSTVVPPPAGANQVLLAKLDPDGKLQAWDTYGGPGSGATFSAGDDRGSRAVVADPFGGWTVAGSFYGNGYFGFPLTSVDQADVFVTKVDQNLRPLWIRSFGGVGNDRPSALTSDKDGNLLLSTLEADGNTMGLYWISRDGILRWAKSFPLDTVTGAKATFHKAIFDDSGMIFVAGSFTGKVDFGDGILVDGGSASFFLACYDPDGNLKFVKPKAGSVDVQDLHLDSNGHVIVFGQYSDPGIDFGAGPFKSRDPDTFMVSYKPDGTFVWAVPMTGYGNNVGQTGDKQRGAFNDSALFTGIGLDSTGNVLGTGVMDGFFLFDNRMLVNWVPPLSYDADAFVGSFAPPCSDDACDTTPPVFVPDSISAPIVVQATLPADGLNPLPGANVWFNDPVATDQDNAGRFGSAIVSCSPASNSRFPVGTTKVTCTAFDAHGNTAEAFIDVTVRNTVGPSFGQPPSKGPYTSQNPAGMVVRYTVQLTDQVDSKVSATCSPQSGSPFQVGVTQVNCDATDDSGNHTHGSFPIWVVLSSDGKNPPGQPKNVTAVPGIRSATVSWTGVPTATSYQVTASDDKNWTTVDGSNSSAVVSGLANGAKVSFTVTAIDGAQLQTTSIPSAQVTILDVPAKPGNLTGTAAPKQVSLAWIPPPSDGGAPVRGYRVETYDGQTLVRSDLPSGTSLTVSGLADARTYHFNVFALNDVGPSLGSAQIDVATPPGAPTQVTAVAGVGQATVSWTASAGSTSYTVTSNPGNKTATVDGSQTSATVTGLANGGTYTFTVVATNAQGSSLPSAPSNLVRLPTAPSAPTNFTATAGVRQLALSWTASSNDGGSPIKWYRVDCYAGSTYLKSFLPTTTSLTVTGLQNGTTYKCSIWAKTDVGNSATVWSPDVTTPAVPDAPTNFTAAAGLRQIALSWTASNSDGGSPIKWYRVDCYAGSTYLKSFLPTTTSLTVTGLQNGTTYKCSIWATNDVGISSTVWSSDVTTPTIPDAPTNFTATAGVRQIALSWTASSSDGGSPIKWYRIDCYAGSTYLKSFLPTTTSLTVTGLQNGTTYKCSIWAKNDVGISSTVWSSDVTTATVPDAPTNVTATAGVRQLALSWTASSSDGGSPIKWYRVDCYAGNTYLKSFLPTTTSLTVTGLQNGTTYKCSIWAKNDVGVSSTVWSSDVTTP